MKIMLHKTMLFALAFMLANILFVAQAGAQTETQVTIPYTGAYEKAGYEKPTVKSNKDDYAPGEIAIITGTGWFLDSLVDIHLEEDPVHDHHHGYHNTKVNPDGTWMIEYQIEERHIGVRFTVIAEGIQTGFKGYTYFTDGTVIFRVSSNLPDGIFIDLQGKYRHNNVAQDSTSFGGFHVNNTSNPPAQVSMLPWNNTRVMFSYPLEITSNNIQYSLSNISVSGSQTLPSLVYTPINGRAYASVDALGGGQNTSSIVLATYIVKCNAPSITINVSNKIMDYGEADPVFSVSANGDGLSYQWQYRTNNSSATWIDVGTNSNSYTVPSPDVSFSGREYRVKITGTCGEVNSSEALLTVNKRPITITVSAGQGKVYGDMDPATLNATVTSGTVVSGDTPSGELQRAAGENVGGYAISKHTYTYGSNYNETFVGANFTITQRPITIRANDRSKKYGDVLVLGNSEYTITSGNLVYGNVITGVTMASEGAVATAKVVAPGPTYSIVPSAATGSAINNYLITYENGTLTIDRRDASVTPNTSSKTYGAGDPVFTGTLTGFVAGDNITAIYSRTAGESVEGSPYTISAVLSPESQLGNYNITYHTASFTITRKILLVKADDMNNDYQYSDVIPDFTVTITGFEFGDDRSVVAGAPAYNTTAQIDNGKIMSPKGEYSIIPSLGTLQAANYSFSFANGKLIVNEEDADIVYSGLEYFATASTSSNVAKVELISTLKDQDDGLNTRGDITNAKADFVTDGSIIGPLANRSVSLLKATDPTVGVARTGLFDVTLSNSDMNNGGKTFEVLTKAVGNYYTGEADDRTLITVAVPGQDFVNGGGHLIINRSSGSYAPAVNSKVNFGFTMKWNKSGKSIQGQANIIIRRLVGNTWRVYQIKSNAINTLGVSNVPGGRRADFNTKANFTDITNPLAPVTITGNLDLSIQAFESTDPTKKDQIGITLRSSTGELLISTHWDGARTEMKDLNGGSIKVRNSTISASAQQQEVLTSMNDQLISVGQFNLTAFPNPSTSSFNVKLESSVTNDKITLRVMDIHGRTIEVRNNLSAGQTLKLGSEYRPGIYFIEMIQGNNRKQLKLMKQGN